MTKEQKQRFKYFCDRLLTCLEQESLDNALIDEESREFEKLAKIICEECGEKWTDTKYF